MLRLTKASKYALLYRWNLFTHVCYILGHDMTQPVMSGTSFMIIIRFKPAEEERLFYKANLLILREGRFSRMVVKPLTSNTKDPSLLSGWQSVGQPFINIGCKVLFELVLAERVSDYFQNMTPFPALRQDINLSWSERL